MERGILSSGAPPSRNSTTSSGIFVGHDALDKFAGDLRATHPHFAYAPHAAPQTLHNVGRLKWGSGPRGGVSSYTGEDVIIVRDEKIAVLCVFLDTSPT